MSRGNRNTIYGDTALVPDIIADTVAETVLGLAYATEQGRWKDMSTSERAEFDAMYKREKQAIESHLVERADKTYQSDNKFRTLMRSKGNEGRDALYVYMYHWIGYDKAKEKVIVPYKDMIRKYQIEKELFEAGLEK